MSDTAPSEPVELAPTEAAGERVALEELPPGRRAVIQALKDAGEATAEELADALSVTTGAIRQQVATLEDSGLVAHRDERRGRGRPRRWYCLTAASEGLFPKRYGQLANQLLGFVADSDPALVDDVFRRRQEARTDSARGRLEGRPFDERVRELTAILDADGYLAGCTQLEPHHWRVVEHNCAVLDVAQRYGHACTSELAFLRDALPDAVIERVAHRLSGGHACAYDIRLADAAPSQDG